MAPAVKFAEALKTDLTKQQAQPTGSRHFTGDSNRGLSKDMEASASSRQGSGTAGSASSKPVTMPTFTAGAASVPVSPSKKRLHRHIKLPQAAAPSGNAPAPKANPFAAHGLTDAAAKATAPSKGSPGKPQQGRTSPINSHRHTVRPNSGVQGMHIDTPVQAAKPTAQPNVFNTTQPTSTKNSASTSTFMGFCGGTAAAVKQQAINQKLNHPGSSFTLGQQAAKAQHAGVVIITGCLAVMLPLIQVAFHAFAVQFCMMSA